MTAATDDTYGRETAAVDWKVAATETITRLTKEVLEWKAKHAGMSAAADGFFKQYIDTLRDNNRLRVNVDSQARRIAQLEVDLYGPGT